MGEGGKEKGREGEREIRNTYSCPLEGEWNNYTQEQNLSKKWVN